MYCISSEPQELQHLIKLKQPASSDKHRPADGSNDGQNPSGSSFRMAQKSQLSQLLNHIMCWPKSWTHPADDDNNRNDRSISHPGCTCGGDGIWVHGTGCLTCTKLRGPEDLLVFSSTQNSDTGTHDAQIAPYLACGSICFARTLHISFLNQTSSTSAPYSINFGALLLLGSQTDEENAKNEGETDTTANV